MGQALPLHIKINELLARELSAGHWRTGERLPPEAKLASDLGCAVGTLRKSLAQLELQGLIERRHGSGTYVKQAPEGKSVYDFFRLSLRNGGGLPTAVILAFDLIPQPNDVPLFGEKTTTASSQTSSQTSSQKPPQTLSQTSQRFCYRVRRLRLLNNIPIALEEIYFDTRHNPALTVNDLGEALYLFYQTHLGFWIASAQDQVSIDRVPQWSNPLFALPAGTPCGYIERRSYASNDALEEYSHTWFNPDVAHYTNRIY